MVGIRRYLNRAGEPAEIVGVAMGTPEGCKPRPCFIIRFADGNEESIPIFTTDATTKDQNYVFITEGAINGFKEEISAK